MLRPFFICAVIVQDNLTCFLNIKKNIIIALT